MKMTKISGLLAVSLLFVIMVSSCTKEARLIRNLEGTWDVTSYTEDGVELMGAFLQSFTMDFESYSNADDEGDVEFVLVDAFVGSTTTDRGTYTVKDEGTEIEITIDGETETFDIELDGDDLTMETVSDGVRYEIEAERD
jgi:hypothetical protein